MLNWQPANEQRIDKLQAIEQGLNTTS